MIWLSNLWNKWFTGPEIKPIVVVPHQNTDNLYNTKNPSDSTDRNFRMVDVPQNLSDLTDLDVVARTIWGEARNQGPNGMTAVACVIQNRARIGGWFGRTPRDVCLKSYQFSCWNKDDTNRAKLLSVTDADPQYQTAKGIANSLLTGVLSDITEDADSYQVKGTNAFWARNLTPVVVIGDHEFYRTAQV